MKLDEQLRHAYQKETGKWTIPERTKGKILNGIRHENDRQGNRKKWLVATLLTVVIIIPTGAYAGYTYLADDIYGSQENITVIGGSPEDYARLEAKLHTAKAYFSQEEFVQYMDLLRQMGQLAIEHADDQGTLHPEQWSNADQKQYALLVDELEPFFEKLETVSADSPRELLDADQFWKEQLSQAEKTFDGEQLAEFKSLYEQMKQYEDQVTDKEGMIHEERMSAKQKEELNQVRERIYIYLEKLGLEVHVSEE